MKAKFLFQVSTWTCLNLTMTWQSDTWLSSSSSFLSSVWTCSTCISVSVGPFSKLFLFHSHLGCVMSGARATTLSPSPRCSCFSPSLDFIYYLNVHVHCPFTQIKEAEVITTQLISVSFQKSPSPTKSLGTRLFHILNQIRPTFNEYSFINGSYFC